MTAALDHLRHLVTSPEAAAAPPPAPVEPAFEAAVDGVVAHLGSDAAAATLAEDGYWPKWDGPWWQMRLLWELGLHHRIPDRAVRGLVASLQAHIYPGFPFDLDTVPPGFDKERGTACHCQLGTMYEVLAACGVAVDLDLPWVRGWFLRYQLPDGGLNCDEGVYLRPIPHSSVVSTLPALEAMLAAPPPLAPAEQAFLARGAAYLLQRRLYWSLSKGTPIDDAWLLPTFLRFYDYDVLRGLAFVVAWAVPRAHVSLRAADIAEAAAALPQSGPVTVGRLAWTETGTRRQGSDGVWGKEPQTGRFALLDRVGIVGAPAPALTASWRRTVAGLQRLEAEGRLRWADASS